MSAPLYVTAEEIKASQNLEDLTFADGDIDHALAAACRAVEKLAGRVFYPSPLLDPDDDDYEPEQRFFTATSHGRIRVDDLLDISEVAMRARGATAYTALDEASYVPAPYNAPGRGQPYEEIELLTGCLPVRARAGVRVTGRFGWLEPPDEVVQAVTILTSRFFRRAREAAFGVVTFSGIDATTAIRIARTDPDLPMLLDGLRRKGVLA